MFKLSERIEKLPPYLFAEIDRLKQEVKQKGIEIIDLGIGDPDIPTPKQIIEAAQKALENPANHQYPSYEGSFEFREAVALWYKDRFGVDLDPGSECLALIGSKEGIAHLPFAFVDRGNYTLVPDPGYPVYSTATMFAGGVVHKMPLLKENGFVPDLDVIDKSILNKTKIMFINYPNNPTSAIATKDFYNRVVELALKYGFLVASDNAYSEIYYDNYKPMSFLEIDGAKEVAIELHSFSKTFNMTGWRIGFAVGNKEGIYGLGKIKTNVDSGVFTALQQAGIYALNNYKVLNEPIRKIFQERKDQMSLALKKANFDFEEPLATFYFWVKVPDGYNSKDFAKKLLEEKGIVVTPGVGFGEYGEGYFRISITNPNIQKAVDAIKSL